MIEIKLYKLDYETYSYYGDDPIEEQNPDSEDFDLETGQLLGIYSSYDIALQKKQYFSKNHYLSNLKRLSIYEMIVDRSLWAEGFISLDDGVNDDQ